MDLYLAGEHEVKNGSVCKTWKNVNILESFYYAQKNAHFERLYNSCSLFLLDSGAFTFLKNNIKHIDWNKYVEEYAGFINKYDIEHFFELDIDAVVGLEKVEKLREKLELLTKKKSIPVWHKNRGKEYFINMCKNYKYVALGGIAIKEIPKEKYNIFPWFIETAHYYGAKIHGLGFTNIKGIKQYKFDSVDSTSWLIGNRAGYIEKFNAKTCTMDKISKPNTRVKPRETAQHNFNEWIKFSNYAKIYL